MRRDSVLPQPMGSLTRSEHDVLPFLARRPRHELEFLPAALEVVDTPAPPAARLVSGVICAFCTVAIVWSIVGRIDIVANAPGTIIPETKVKLIQPLQTATVSQVLVADGDHVEPGQALVRLDAVAALAERDRLAADLAAARLDAAGLQALRETLLHPGSALVYRAPAGVTATASAREYVSIAARLSEQTAKLANLAQQIAEKRAEAAENVSVIAKLRTDLPALAGIRDMYSTLYAEQLASRVDLLSSQQRFSDAAHDLATQIEHGDEAGADIAALAMQYKVQEADYARGVLQDAAAAEQRLTEVEVQYRAAVHQGEQMVLRAPVTGTVQQLSVHTPGAVVMPAERLMVIAPDRDRLVVEAMVNNRDIGFVHVGQVVNVKVGTFSFTRYGMIRGRVVNLSRDAVDDTPREAEVQTLAATSGGPAGPAGSEPDLDGGQGSGYVARIVLDHHTVDVDGRRAELELGMSVTAEILTGRRRVISYILSPLMHYVHDTGHER